MTTKRNNKDMDLRSRGWEAAVGEAVRMTGAIKVAAVVILVGGLAVGERAQGVKERAAAERGERLFAQIGCIDCHRPALLLENPIFSEPNPFNPPGNLRPMDVERPITFDLTRDGPGPRLERTPEGKAIVRAFTDLKRHVICDEQDPFFCNERVVQDGVPVDQFLTRKLWDVGSTAPYGHRGDLTTITEAILHHAGEARPHRERFEAFAEEDQAAIVEFLKTLQVLPPGAPPVVTESQLRELVTRRKAAGREWNQ